MKKKITVLYVAMFVVMLVLPYLLYLYVAKYLDLENHENHVLVTMDDVIEAPWYEKTTTLENFIDDHLPYKNELTKFNTFVDINVFKSLDSKSVLLGKEDWLFYKLDNCIEDYRGSLTISEEEVNAAITSMQNFKDYCDEHDIELVFMVMPNKETIYGEYYMPDYVEIMSSKSRVDTLVERIQEETDIEIRYPKKELLDARDAGYQVYKKYDTHWNMLGGYIGTMDLFEALEVENESISNFSIEKKNNITGDLANMIAMGDVFNDDIDYVLKGYKDEINVELVEELEQPNLNYSHYKSNASNDESIMCIGDSFLEMTEEYIAKNFSQSYFMHISNYEQGTIEKADPDIIVVTSTERAFPGLQWSIDAMMENLAK